MRHRVTFNKPSLPVQSGRRSLLCRRRGCCRSRRWFWRPTCRRLRARVCRCRTPSPSRAPTSRGPARLGWRSEKLKVFFKNGPSRPLFHLFSYFQTHCNPLQKVNVKKCPSWIWCQDSNSRPLEHESPPTTTSPGKVWCDNPKWVDANWGSVVSVRDLWLLRSDFESRFTYDLQTVKHLNSKINLLILIFLLNYL